MNNVTTPNPGLTLLLNSFSCCFLSCSFVVYLSDIISELLSLLFDKAHTDQIYVSSNALLCIPGPHLNLVVMFSSKVCWHQLHKDLVLFMLHHCYVASLS